VDAAPEKEFFISMLVKDIELIPAITDLVDNSVDGALALRGERSFEGLEVAIAATPEKFSITDNCGGIDADIARHYAFRFGRPVEHVGVEGSVGQFGVGMKRALFKLGREFRVESQARSSRFVLHVDVEEWAKEDDPDWTFRFRELDEHYAPESDDDLGTIIEVLQLHEGISEEFELSQTMGRLRADLQLRHQRAIAAGLRITVNDEELIAHTPMLVHSERITPIRRAVDIRANGSSVHLELIAGLVRSYEDGRDEADAESFRSPGEAGWYLFCNDRLVIAADRSRLTGWGSAAAAYHPQYRHFRGYAYLTAADPALLPWNTTKTGVDQESEVFRVVQGEMARALQGVLAVINRLKREQQDWEPEDRPLAAALADARPVALAELPSSDTMRVPPLPAAPPPDFQRIQYSVGRAEYEQVRAELGATSGSEVGRATFRYFYESQVEQ
jgi:hypothetical protein